MLLLKVAELTLLANCWRANKIWSCSTVAGVFLLRKCDWIVERACFCLPAVLSGEQKGILSWTRVTMWDVSLIWVNSIAGPTCREPDLGRGVTLKTIPSGIPGSLGHCSEMFLERFRRASVPVDSSESRPIWPELLKCGTQSCLIPGTVFLWPCPQPPQKLAWCTPRYSRTGSVLWLAVPNDLMRFLWNNFQLSLVS